VSTPSNPQRSAEAVRDAADSELLAEWVRRYRPVLTSYFRKRLRGTADVEDLVQEAFLRLARQHELRAVKWVEPYLFQVASNVLTDYVRTAVVRHRQHHEIYEDEAHPTEVYAPETVLADRQFMSRVLAALKELPERTQTIFFLRRWDELPNTDIARMMGISVSAVEKHITKALAHLKERMADL